MAIGAVYGRCGGLAAGLRAAYTGPGFSVDAGFGLKAVYKGGLFCATSGSSKFLLEDGFGLLLEDGGLFKLEG